MSFKVSVDRFDEGYRLDRRLGTDFARSFASIRRGDLVVMKVNMFVTRDRYFTDLRLLTEAARFFKDLGARVVIAERLQALHEVCARMPELARYAEIQSLDDVPIRMIRIEGATSLRLDMGIPSIILDCDFFVTAPQFRTHAGVLFSNGMKNLVGILPGYTTRMVHNVGLTEAIVDLNRIRPPDFVISDLITTIEGDYPIAGTVMDRGLVLLGNNVVAADLTAARLAGFDPRQVEYLELSHQAGLGPSAQDPIEVLGDFETLRFDCIKGGLKNRPGTRVELEHEGACIECRRYCNSFQKLLLEETPEGEEVLVASGPSLSERVGRHPSDRTILVGTCTYQRRHQGIYIEGCPPRALQARAVVDRLKNGDFTQDLHKNQCRWPERQPASRSS